MAGVSGGLLAAETCRAGGLGFIAAPGYFQDPTALDKEIQIFQECCIKYDEKFPLCIGFIGHAALQTDAGWERYERALHTHKPQVVQFFAPSIKFCDATNKTNVELAHEHNALFVAQVGNVAEAQQAIEAGVDAIMAQGSDAGGHGLRRELGTGTLTLASQIASMTDIPVLAAGGIVTGRSVAAALAVCDGAVLGTRLWASTESIGAKHKQEALVKAKSCDDVIRTTVFDHMENNFLSTPWEFPYDSVGALRNQFSEKWDNNNGFKQALQDETFLNNYKKAQKEKNLDIDKVLSGKGVGEIHSIEPAFDILQRIENETQQAISRLSSIVS